MKNVMTGLAVLGTQQIETIALIVAGHYDFQLKCAFYYSWAKKIAETAEALEDPNVLVPLENLKNILRRDIQEIFKQAEKEDHEQLIKNLKETNKPHEMGTVAEIAAKYNISKSEVRRRKADGTLSELK